jgi:outer membrane protein OmpA-like peptidoglycan-associated protein
MVSSCSQTMLNYAHTVQPAKPSRSAPAHRSSNGPKIGNQAAQRLLRDGVIQAKLTVNRPGDKFEQEADRVAETVMRMPELPTVQATGISGRHVTPSLQRMCPTCEDEQHASATHIQRVCSDCKAELNSDRDEEENLQTKQASGLTPEINPGIQARIDSLRGGGQPLPGSLRAFFEPRFGHNFSNVRIHSYAQAAEAARSVNALAYTRGSDVVFGAGQYRPETYSGRKLLAHELAHVVQQSGDAAKSQGARPASVQRLGDPSQAPAGMICPIANTSPAFRDTDVLFSLGSSTLTPTAISDIASFIARWNAAGANKTVRVDGYASTDGPEPLNWTLSCDRALMVEGELMAPSSGAPGIPASFIQIFAQGETSEFSTALAPNRRATISADLAAPPRPVCANPGVSRNLDLQPVFLRTDPADASPTGTSWTRRFNEANTIWGKIGGTFNDLGAITLDTPLKTNGTTDAEINAVRALRSRAGVEVFLVDNDMTSSGGASKAPGPGASCGAAGNIVMSDRGTSNTLLAHELGHILGLQHPGTPPNPGEAGTILEPSNSNSAANPTRNTLANFNRLLCPAPTGSTCLNPDV